ncbi:MAG: hypothetical protein RSP_14700 [Rhodanobacter sp.]
MNFEFVPAVTPGLFNATRDAWQTQLRENPENTSETYYSAGLAYLERALDGGVFGADGAGGLSAVVENGNSFASALIVISHAKAKTDDAYLKMLNIYVQPNLNLADSEPNYAELAWIAANAIVGGLGLTYKHYPSRQLKIHTVFPLDKEFLTAVMTVMMREREFSQNYDVSFHANWLVVTKKDVM